MSRQQVVSAMWSATNSAGSAQELRHLQESTLREWACVDAGGQFVDASWCCSQCAVIADRCGASSSSTRTRGFPRPRRSATCVYSERNCRTCDRHHRRRCGRTSHSAASSATDDECIDDCQRLTISSSITTRCSPTMRTSDRSDGPSQHPYRQLSITPLKCPQPSRASSN